MLQTNVACLLFGAPQLTGREMSALTPRRIALIVVATVVLLFFVGMLSSGHAGMGSTGDAIIGPVVPW